MADTPASDVLYVAKTSTCSDTAADSGSQGRPFCTISAAAGVVEPGQTVLVEAGDYPESVTITRSGTADAPITFVSNDLSLNPAYVRGRTTAQGATPAFTVSGAQHVVLRRFSTTAPGGAPSVLIDHSSDITVDRAAVNSSAGAPAIRITGTSRDVTLSRTSVTHVANGSPGVAIDGGASGTVLSADTVFSPRATNHAPGIAVSGAPGTVVTGDTVVGYCTRGIVLDGDSSGSTVKNDVVEEAANGWASSPSACASTADATAISVADTATSGTSVDDNVIDPTSGGSLYSWAGTGYPDASSFAAATGQGGADISASPQLTEQVTGPRLWFQPGASSPVIDSADPSAPGETATDFFGDPREDDPSVPDTATGYYDRGAVEVVGPTSGGGYSIQPLGSSNPLQVTVTTIAPTPAWTANGPIDRTYSYVPDDATTGFPIDTDGTFTYTFHRAGDHAIRRYDLRGGGPSPDKHVVVGADYTPLTPVRLLDTRHAVGVTTTAAVAAGADVVLPVPSVAGIPAADVSAVVANVTVTQPTAAGHLTLYPHNGQSLPTASNLNFTAGQTVANLVTVPLGGDGVVIHNGSSGTVHVLMDLQGFYGQAGSGFKPVSPTRVLDTRSGLGTSAARAITPRATLSLDLSGRIPAGTTAVVLNLTVTRPTQHGYLTAYPDAGAMPAVSNLNFTAGQTIANLAVVPVTDGKADFYNGSGGTVQIVADLAGYFGSAAAGENQSYVPAGPTRLVDTRSDPDVTGPVPAYGNFSFYPWWHKDCAAGCPQPTGAVLNVTATQPRKNGFLTVYPNEQTVPNASNLNFTAGQTVPSLVSVADPGLIIGVYNHSSGSVQIVVDEEGYYIAPQTWAN
ncbi:right-handed parallel beta-helix repeat-containing protein [Streptomyces gilvus]|uniref:right-handed parallel beta-helix repeat-containing protein n=1 Tax=Streptomyces gilvus TaxID=2920937 RepID=UPI001F0D986F|nr:right-handed parallel beta-helix repeat-containing protein [Streptomyces sp. CME 23]MCH5677048.1 right-handed parallel beta-helix repeat-containing protein [Streptomyces sp. CME 23]